VQPRPISTADAAGFTADMLAVAEVGLACKVIDFERIKKIRAIQDKFGDNADTPSPHADWFVNRFHQLVRDMKIAFDVSIADCTIGEGNVVD
jgi:hypothetical protein